MGTDQQPKGHSIYQREGAHWVKTSGVVFALTWGPTAMLGSSITEMLSTGILANTGCKLRGEPGM